mmetsp:Transcript_99673/g.266302  ORF Transcript_99673/g.266302 Transcript_99673/m.266302 type:complete len:295 (+) Transcript_99673:1000-1884(+)
MGQRRRGDTQHSVRILAERHAEHQGNVGGDGRLRVTHLEHEVRPGHRRSGGRVDRGGFGGGRRGCCRCGGCCTGRATGGTFLHVGGGGCRGACAPGVAPLRLRGRIRRRRRQTRGGGSELHELRRVHRHHHRRTAGERHLPPVRRHGKSLVQLHAQRPVRAHRRRLQRHGHGLQLDRVRQDRLERHAELGVLGELAGRCVGVGLQPAYGGVADDFHGEQGYGCCWHAEEVAHAGGHGGGGLLGPVQCGGAGRRGETHDEAAHGGHGGRERRWCGGGSLQEVRVAHQELLDVHRG